ncbi:hypothetical protein BU15DRAFT_58291 [Melanogaster broomeanus]|nr:hypothetical protein BU15DRAFT_58291 [Melanogaster broomeanus]
MASITQLHSTLRLASKPPNKNLMEMTRILRWISFKEPHGTLLANVYSRPKPDFSHETVASGSWDTIQWTETGGEEVHLLKIWPLPRTLTGTIVRRSWWDWWMRGEWTRTSVPELQTRPTHTEHERCPTAPFRLYDCENQILKDQQTYLRETNNVAPPYLVVSHVWGNIQEQMSLPTVEWPVPISSKAKWDAILHYCRNENVKWLWMDILCINQSRTSLDLFHTIVSTDAPVKDNTTFIWECIAHVDAMMSDQYFWRMWTFQELLLPAKHVLLDGQELRTSSLRSVLEWYYRILRNGSLKRPSDGREYSFIKPDNETVIEKNWDPKKLGWNSKEELDQKGHVDLIKLVSQARDKGCKLDVDRLLALYGLLSDDEKVPIETPTTLQIIRRQDNDSRTWFGMWWTWHGDAPLTQKSTPTAPKSKLALVWERTMCNAVTSGRVWPLLHDIMLVNWDLDEARVANWMPDIKHSTMNHRNTGSIRIIQDELHIPVRVVGRVVGASASIGDGGGEVNKLITCTWILKARGFDVDPIVHQFKDGLAGSDGVPLGGIDEAHHALDTALSAQSLPECFSVVEAKGLRRKLVYAPGVAGWDKMVLAVQIDGRTTPAVCLAWVHRKLLPMESGCLVLDVTSDPLENVQRWVVANTAGSNKVQKIGTVRSFSSLFGDSMPTSEVVFT